ncbi:AAA family ATPase [Clostridium estertheticum]|uniref:AAA family ATPase n=1 Tax=Clostridium estertheticum TaxID=238834 RepID=UPI0013EEA983|nr:AAA family ATPase [Clostridium estertheticum]MBZ9608218.1 AAA family ATPase [Clostridium estertheticum]
MNKIVIFYGSRSAFEEILPKNGCRNLTDLVMEIDTDNRSFILVNQEKPLSEKQKTKVENFIIESDEYSGVREHVILNFANFLAKLDVENLYIQNPPISISSQIEKLYSQVDIIKQEYSTIKKDDLVLLYNTYESRIKGQGKALKSLLQALYPITNANRNKPVVILFYGDTGLGKTETAHAISDVVKERLFRKQFSMFQNNQFATYLFGGAHYEKSFAKELLDRESNVILLDEFDKANSTFHSAFYQLFDEGIYEDPNYHLELKKSIIICTSNYKSIDDIKSNLGKAIFSRFDSVIKFDDLSINSKKEIANMQYEQKYKSYTYSEQTLVSNFGIKNKLIERCTLCSNAREISHLIDNTFALILLRDLVS